MSDTPIGNETSRNSDATKPARPPARALDTRENTTRPKVWQQPGSIPNPEPREGIRFKWVRSMSGGVTDTTNMHRSLSEGWAPCTVEDVPELAHLIHGFTAVTGVQGFAKDTIVYGGLMLMKIDAAIAAQRNAFYQNRHDQQERSVDEQLMSNADSRMPLSKSKKSKVSKFGHE